MSRFAEKRKHSRKQRAEQRHVDRILRKPWLDPERYHQLVDDLAIESAHRNPPRKARAMKRRRRNCGGSMRRRNPEVSVDSFSPRPQFGEWLIAHSSKKRGDAIYELGVIWAEKGTAYGYSLIEAVKSARARAKGRNATVFKRISAKLTALLHGRGRKVNPARKYGVAPHWYMHPNTRDAMTREVAREIKNERSRRRYRQAKRSSRKGRR